MFRRLAKLTVTDQIIVAEVRCNHVDVCRNLTGKLSSVHWDYCPSLVFWAGH